MDTQVGSVLVPPLIPVSVFIVGARTLSCGVRLLMGGFGVVFLSFGSELMTCGTNIRASVHPGLILVMYTSMVSCRLCQYQKEKVWTESGRHQH